jgi:hypothetical protein
MEANFSDLLWKPEAENYLYISYQPAPLRLTPLSPLHWAEKVTNASALGIPNRWHLKGL